MYEFIHEIPYFILYFIAFYITGSIVGKQAKYFKVHSLLNAFLTIITFNDMITLLQEPLIDGDHSTYPRLARDLLFTFHLYHIICFNKVLSIDIIHHLVMSGVIISSYTYNVALIANYCIFFINGLPGLMDYIMLILVKYRYLESIVEKKYNSYIQIWLRSPFVVIGAYILYIRYTHGIFVCSIYNIIFAMFGIFWNGQYFALRIIHNYGYYDNGKINDYN